MLLKKMPSIYSNSGTMIEIFQAEDLEIQQIEDSLESTLNQFFIDSADTTIDRWEKEVGLPKSSLPLEQRRDTVKSKLRGYGTVTVAHIKSICDAYTNGDVTVTENNNDYSFEIQFNSVRGIPLNIEDLKKIIEQIKPAHLGVIYKYKYLKWDELDAENVPWYYLDELAMTWDEFEVWKPKFNLKTFDGTYTFDGTLSFNGKE